MPPALRPERLTVEPLVAEQTSVKTSVKTSAEISVKERSRIPSPFTAPTHDTRFIALMDRHWPSWRAARSELNALPLASWASQAPQAS